MVSRRLSPREAAAWLAEHGCPGTLLTLEKWRSYGRGPAWLRIGTRIRYDIIDLENYARGQRVPTVDCADLADRR